MPTDLPPILRQAVAWVIRLHSGAATTDDAQNLALWRNASPEHEAAFRDAVKLWKTFGEGVRQLAAQTADAGPQRSRSDVARPHAMVVSRRGLMGGAIAASALIGYVAIRHPPLGLWPSLDELSADYRTSKGEQRTVAVSDDVSLKLNTQTSISVRSNANERRIEIISGEAAIIANRARSTALLVDAATGQIEAIAASFNVRCVDGHVSVSCLDGGVDVKWNGQGVHLGKDQQISYSASTGFGQLASLDSALVTAWQDGLLIVRDWPLSRVVEEINRYRSGKIVVMDALLGQRMITGTFRLDHLDDFIGQARGLFGASVYSLPGGVVILS